MTDKEENESPSVRMNCIIDVQPEPAEEEPEIETDSDDKEPGETLLAKFPKELQQWIKKAVNNPTFKQFWEERLEMEDVNTLKKLICKISEKSGDGSFHSNLLVLYYLCEEYSCEDNQYIFEGIAEIIDGEMVG